MQLLIIAPKELVTKEIKYNYLFPLGLAYISSILKKSGYSVDCLNLNHYYGTAESLLNDYLIKKKYDFVLTGGLSTSYNQIKCVVDAVHNFKDKIV